MSEILSQIDVNNYGLQSMVNGGGGSSPEDLSVELAAQDSALSTQQNIIDELEAALDNKISLDLTAATSDATATANDIVKGKTAYSNGIKLTGTYEGVKPVIPNGVRFEYSTASDFSWIINADFSQMTDMGALFMRCSQILTLPVFDTSHAINISNMCSYCTSLRSFPLINTENVTKMQSVFTNCNYLETVPLLNTSKVTNMTGMFNSCPTLSNESLNNILRMCINSAVTTNKTLAMLSLNNDQRAICQTLSNWDDFVAAGWTVQ